MKKHIAKSLLALFSFSSLTLEAAPPKKPARTPAAKTMSYAEALNKLSLRVVRANLHAHHYMGNAPVEFGPGECPRYKNFAEDDGKPCHDDGHGKEMLIDHPFTSKAVTEEEKIMSYFTAACDYAYKKGKLEAMFITLHSKTGNEKDTDSKLPGFVARQKLLKTVNQKYQGKFYCGLGQEASSISTGNHVNIFGQFSENQDSSSVTPLYFQSGDFKSLYADVTKRVGKGEKIILQMNHPDVKDDLWWGTLEGKTGKQIKEKLNDYGLDDYAPVGCVIKKALSLAGREVQMPEGCETRTESEISHEMVKETLQKLNQASVNRYKLIEVVSPGQAAENATEVFRPVHARKEKGDRDPEGLYDYIFYLANGFKLAPTANQDNHRFNFGTATASRTGLLIKNGDINEAKILTAMDERKTFASEDMNAEVLAYAEDKDAKPILMGEEVKTKSKNLVLNFGYQDSDAIDSDAEVRIIRATSKDEFDFSYAADRSKTVRLLSLENGKTSMPIKAGSMIKINVPVEKGGQWFLVEIKQKSDLDRVWSAPFWVTGE